jgi:hypothetical protein
VVRGAWLGSMDAVRDGSGLGSWKEVIQRTLFHL